MKCFACQVEGLATIYIEADDEDDAATKLEIELMGIADSHGLVLNITAV